MQNLIPGEELITESNDHTLKLTTHRVCVEVKDWGRRLNQHVMLEQVSSVQNNFSSHIIFLAAAALAMIVGFMTVNQEKSFMDFSIILGVICVVLYFLTMRRVLTISSSSVKMKIYIAANNSEMMLEFMDRLAEAISNRRMRVVN